MKGSRATLQDVAARAGVSMKTVSNVVRGYPHVSPGMRERVQVAIDALGYRPNLSGRQLATGRSSMLALAIPDLRRPYFAELAHAFVGLSAQRGYRMLLEQTGGTADGERSALRDRDVGLVDGVILYPQALSLAELAVLDPDAPLVLLGEDPGPPGTDHVAIDNVAAADAAVTHLITVLGRRRIGFLGTRPHRSDRPQRCGCRATRRRSSGPGSSATTGSWSRARSATPSARSTPSPARSMPACGWTRCCAATTSRRSAACGRCGWPAWTSLATSR